MKLNKVTYYVIAGILSAGAFYWTWQYWQLRKKYAAIDKKVVTQRQAIDIINNPILTP